MKYNFEISLKTYDLDVIVSIKKEEPINLKNVDNFMNHIKHRELLLALWG